MDGKARLFNIEKFVKNENLATGRLATLKLPRDLSLGNPKPKKIYAPNVNAIRNRNKVKEQVKQIENNGVRKSYEKNKNKRKPPKTNVYVQSAGIFSEGTTDIKRPSNNCVRKSSHSDRDSSVAAVVMPKLNRNIWNVNKQEEATIANDLVNIACEEDDSSTDIEYEPVILPLEKNKVKFSENFKVTTETDIKIKQEPKDDISGSSAVINENLESSSKHNITSNQNDFQWTPISAFNSKRKFSEDENIMSLVRLPDSLPGKAFGEDSNQLVDFDLSHLMEGQIGKILVRKSGKMEVVIADMVYQLESEEPSPFTEEIVMFPGKNSTSLDTNLVSLGSVEEKLTITPKWDCLFQDKKT